MVALMGEDYRLHTSGRIDPYAFGNAVAPLVNALRRAVADGKAEHRAVGSWSIKSSDD